MKFIESVRNRAKALKKRIVFPEGTEPRTLQAVQTLVKEAIIIPVLLGNPEQVTLEASRLNIDLSGIDIIEPESSDKLHEFAETYYELRKNKGVTVDEALVQMKDSIYFGTMMVHKGMVDGYLAGAITTTAKTVQAGLRILKTKPGIKTMSSFFFMIHPEPKWGNDGMIVMADAAIVVDMTAEAMAEIAVTTARNAQAIAGIEPKVAMLSYSTKGSGSGASVEMVKKATEIARNMAPDLAIDGEMQADAAIVRKVADLKAPGSKVAGNANVLIFPSIDSANIGYKLVQRLAGMEAVGPVLQGLSKPANDLSRGCSIDDIVNTAAITALQA